MKTTLNNTSTARTKLCRERLTADGYQRFEVALRIKLINNLREVAEIRNMKTYEAVEKAINLLVKWHNDSVGVNN
jgi:hypothetical protein